MTSRLRNAGLTLFTYLVVLALFFPIFWTVLAGFKTEGTAVAQPPVLFFTPTFDNFREALTSANYKDFFIHSVLISVCSTLVAFLLGIPAAFALGLFPTEKTAGTLSWVLSMQDDAGGRSHHPADHHLQSDRPVRQPRGHDHPRTPRSICRS